MPEKALEIYLDGEHIGRLVEAAGGALKFSYDSGRTPTDVPLSLSMPTTATTHQNRVVRAYLDGLLPDNDQVRRRWAEEYGVSARNPFALLRHVGRDAAGAIQVIPPGDDVSDAAESQGDIDWLDESRLHDLLEAIARHPDDWGGMQRSGRWSLAGAQSKVALFGEAGRWGTPRDATPTTHILKPAISGYEGHHLNEHLCLRAAAEAGLRAARTTLLVHDEWDIVVSERYDREKRGARWRRLHQEDLCQALGQPPEKKYQADGGPGIAEVGALFSRLRGSARASLTRDFFDALAFNVLIGAPDAHAKNYSVMLGRRGAVSLAPLYDVASIVPYYPGDPVMSAMKIGDAWETSKIGVSDWAKVGRQLGLRDDAVEERLSRLTRVLPEAFERAATTDIPDTLRAQAAEMADAITQHVRRVGTSFL
ncbi:HipA domain-containing protein [Mumia sp. ZJ430]|uniref:HipA domain-containing protein n=1 Tax=Mumia sp. ZJ430 TaxID=2708083 RepID=UPI00142336F7|nr:HipA domain-containing protein [Mumia sp. ZJ430]